MKIFTIILVTATFNFELLTLNCIAQPNAGFENWSNEFTYEKPDDWVTLNFFSILTPPNPLSAFKAVGLDVHSGNYAVKMKTIFVNNNPYPAKIRDTMGGAFTGIVNPSPLSYRYGFPYTGRPEKLEFWAKYSPVGNDTGGAQIFLLKWNGVSHDTIAFTGIKVFPTTVYTFFQSNLTYYSGAAPDSATIFFGSSFDSIHARVGSILFVDDVALSGWVGIDEQNFVSGNLKIFPNPAKENLTIYTPLEEAENIRVTDASGKLIDIYKIQNCEVKINTGIFAQGIYFCEILNKKDKVLTKGKFNVIK